MMSKIIGKINPFLWRALYAYYSVSVVYITDTNDKTVKVKIKVTIGMKQGGPLSPRMFIRYTNDMI